MLFVRKSISLIKNVFVFFVFLIYFLIIVNILINNGVNELNNFGLLFLFLIIFCLMVISIIWVVKRISITKKKIFWSFVVLIALQIIFAILFVVVPTWDFGHVYNIAVQDVGNGIDMFSGDYLSTFDLNAGVAILLKIVFWVANFFNFKHYVVIGILLNILFIDLSIYFLYKLLNLVFKRKVAFLFLLIAMLFTPFILYVPIFYSDTLSMPFAIGALYFYYKYEYSSCKGKYDLIIASLMITIGSCIKMTVLIMGIAIILNYIFQEKEEKWSIRLRRMMLLIVVIGIPIIGFKICTINRLDPIKVDALKMPYAHTLMMALSGNGGFNSEDYGYSSSFGTLELRTEADIEQIKYRLNYHWNNDFIQFYTNKILYTWGDGTFYAPEKLGRTPKYKREIGRYIHGEDDYYLKYFGQAEWLFILVFLTIGCVFRRYLNKQQRDLQFLLLVLCIGLLGFFAIWEARSRYLVNMLPPILMVGFLGMQAFYNYLINKPKCATIFDNFMRKKR